MGNRGNDKQNNAPAGRSGGRCSKNPAYTITRKKNKSKEGK